MPLLFTSAQPLLVAPPLVMTLQPFTSAPPFPIPESAQPFDGGDWPDRLAVESEGEEVGWTVVVVVVVVVVVPAPAEVGEEVQEDKEVGAVEVSTLSR